MLLSMSPSEPVSRKQEKFHSPCFKFEIYRGEHSANTFGKQTMSPSSLSSLRSHLHEQYQQQKKSYLNNNDALGNDEAPVDTEPGLYLCVAVGGDRFVSAVTAASDAHDSRNRPTTKSYFIPVQIFHLIFSFLPTRHLISKCLRLNSVVEEWIRGREMRLMWFQRAARLVGRLPGSRDSTKNASVTRSAREQYLYKSLYSASADWFQLYVRHLKKQHSWWNAQFNVETWKMRTEWILKPGKFSEATRRSMDVTRLPYHPSQRDRNEDAQSTGPTHVEIHSMQNSPSWCSELNRVFSQSQQNDKILQENLKNQQVVTFLDSTQQLSWLNLNTMVAEMNGKHPMSDGRYAFTFPFGQYIIGLTRNLQTLHIHNRADSSNRVYTYNVHVQDPNNQQFMEGFQMFDTFWREKFAVCEDGTLAFLNREVRKIVFIDLIAMGESDTLGIPNVAVQELQLQEDREQCMYDCLAISQRYVAFIKSWQQQDDTLQETVSKTNIVVLDRQTGAEIQSIDIRIPQSKIFYNHQYSAGESSGIFSVQKLQFSQGREEHIELAVKFTESKYKPDLQRSAFGIIAYNIFSGAEVSERHTFMLDTRGNLGNALLHFGQMGPSNLSIFYNDERFTVASRYHVLTCSRLHTDEYAYKDIPFPTAQVQLDEERIVCSTRYGIYCLKVQD